MTIPAYATLHLEALKLLKNNSELKSKEFEKYLAKVFSLSDSEISQMYDSGKGPIFYDRICWSLSYLNLAGLVNKPKRGLYQINESGLKLLETPDELESYIQSKVRKRTAEKKEGKTLSEPIPPPYRANPTRKSVSIL